MRVLVIDDSAFMRGMIGRIIDAADGLELAGMARNGRVGVEMATALRPDLIVLDIEMPELDGLGTLRQIRIKCRDHAPAVLMCSSLTGEGTAEALRALRLGAADVIAKEPASFGSGDRSFENGLIARLRAMGAERERAVRSRPVQNAEAPDRMDGPDAGLFRPDAIVVGSGAGGAPALEDVFALLPRALRVPIIVAQRMPEPFTASLAARLAQQCACPVFYADRDARIDGPGVYLGAGGRGLTLERDDAGRVQLRSGDSAPPDAPRTNALFESGARVYGAGLLGVQLSADGDDGVLGAAAVRRAGGRVALQCPSTCTFAAVPRTVAAAGQVDWVMPTERLAALLREVGAEATQVFYGGKTPPAERMKLPVIGDVADQRAHRKTA